MRLFAKWGAVVGLALVVLMGDGVSPAAYATPNCSGMVCSLPAKAAKKNKAPKKKAKKVLSALCPVMRSKIADVSKAAGQSVYKGKTYYFCCGGCKEMFDKNPEKYLKK